MIISFPSTPDSERFEDYLKSNTFTRLGLVFDHLEVNNGDLDVFFNSDKKLNETLEDVEFSETGSIKKSPFFISVVIICSFVKNRTASEDKKHRKITNVVINENYITFEFDERLVPEKFDNSHGTKPYYKKKQIKPRESEDKDLKILKLEADIANLKLQLAQSKS